MDSFFLFVNKPIGWTSQKTLTHLKKKFHFKKIGHHGTLDPFATGLLLVGVNEATKFFQYTDDSQKTYEATLKLGEQTDTGDLTGTVIETESVPELSEDQIRSVLKTFEGNLEQVPPMYSAVKVGGKKLYELAREGKTVERKSRQVTIFQLKMTFFEKPFLKIEATVSRGTYIRTLGEQIAEKLGTCAHLTELKRTALTDKLPKKIYNIDENPDESKIDLYKIPIEELLSHWPTLSLSEENSKKMGFGQRVSIEKEVLHTKICRIFDNQKHFLGLALLEDKNSLKALRLMNLSNP